MANLIKPRLSRDEFLMRGRQWICIDERVAGIGPTPREAYLNWLGHFFDHMHYMEHRMREVREGLK